MFTGFNIKFPEYEVITPQTKQSYTVRSLTVQEEEKLKASLVTPGKVLDHLNSCIFECIVKKPSSITDYNSFLKNVTIKDRDALLYGLYHITYEEVRNYDVVCTSCSNKHSITIQASDTFNYNEFPGNDILKKTVIVDLPSTKGVSAYIKQPTLEDESKMMKEFGNNVNDSNTETLVIEKFEQNIDKSKEPITISKRQDILFGYMQLLPKDRKAIQEKYLENFGKYGIDLKMKVDCPKCGHSEVTSIDLVESFFRNIYTA